ncbi:MAG: CAP domain-containing protein, partial [Solirubrobacteraceae bacterium]
ALSLDQASAERTMLCLTNYARTRSGLQPLRANPLLAQAGQAKLTADLGCGEFSHTPCGRPFRSVFAAYLRGASSYQIGENIAWGSGDYGTPRQTMNSWLHSAAHRKNILTPDFRELGIGYQPHETFQGYSDATLWSQEFGTRK